MMSKILYSPPWNLWTHWINCFAFVGGNRAQPAAITKLATTESTERATYADANEITWNATFYWLATARVCVLCCAARLNGILEAEPIDESPLFCYQMLCVRIWLSRSCSWQPYVWEGRGKFVRRRRRQRWPRFFSTATTMSLRCILFSRCAWVYWKIPNALYVFTASYKYIRENRPCEHVAGGAEINGAALARCILYIVLFGLLYVYEKCVWIFNLCYSKE